MGTLPPALAKYMAEKAPAKKGAPKGKGELPKTPANNKAIVARIENKLGPVHPGHHNSHRTAALMDWLAKQESKGKK